MVGRSDTDRLGFVVWGLPVVGVRLEMLSVRSN